MDKLNTYKPVPMKVPTPELDKKPCLTPACKAINEAFMKQQQFQPISNNTMQQQTKK